MTHAQGAARRSDDFMGRVKRTGTDRRPALEPSGKRRQANRAEIRAADKVDVRNVPEVPARPAQSDILDRSDILVLDSELAKEVAKQTLGNTPSAGSLQDLTTVVYTGSMHQDKIDPRYFPRRCASEDCFMGMARPFP